MAIRASYNLASQETIDREVNTPVDFNMVYYIKNNKRGGQKGFPVKKSLYSVRFFPPGNKILL